MRYKWPSDLLRKNVHTRIVQDAGLQSFFDHIRSTLDNPRSSPTVGSDDEKALRNAEAQAWPQWHHIYCHRHLHTNCTEYMSRKVGLTDQQKKPMLAAVFGDAGVTAANSRVVFDGRLANATSIAYSNNFATLSDQTFSTTTAQLLHITATRLPNQRRHTMDKQQRVCQPRVEGRHRMKAEVTVGPRRQVGRTSERSIMKRWRKPWLTPGTTN